MTCLDLDLQVLDDLQNDPKNSQQHLQQPHIRANIDKLVSAGIVQMRWDIWDICNSPACRDITVGSCYVALQALMNKIAGTQYWVVDDPNLMYSAAYSSACIHTSW